MTEEKKEQFELGAWAYRRGMEDGLELGITFLTKMLVDTLPELGERLKENLIVDVDHPVDYDAVLAKYKRETNENNR